jgi:hypothetical protein
MIEELWHAADINVQGDVTKERIENNTEQLSNYVAY